MCSKTNELMDFATGNNLTSLCLLLDFKLNILILNY